MAAPGFCKWLLEEAMKQQEEASARQQPLPSSSTDQAWRHTLSNAPLGFHTQQRSEEEELVRISELGAGWQQKCSTPAERLGALLNAGKFSDLTLVLPAHDTTFKVHRLVLGMTSPVWEERVYGAYPSAELCMEKSATPEGVRWLLDYLYTGCTTFTCTTTALQVASLAATYRIRPLMPVCSKFIGSCLTRDNILEVYNAGVLLENYPLIQRALHMLRVEGNDALSNEKQIVKMERAAVKRLLQENLFVRSEVVIFKALDIWGRGELSSRGEKVTGPALRREIDDLLPFVRLLTLSASDIVQMVMPSGVLTQDESSATLQHVTKGIRNLPPLPPICCPNRIKRETFTPESLGSVYLPAWVRTAGSSIKVTQFTPQVLISKLRVNSCVAVKCIEVTCLRVASLEMVVLDASGETVNNGQAHSPKFEFIPPVVLHPAHTTTVKIFLNDRWYNVQHPFIAQAHGVTFEGVMAPLSKGLEIFFWSWNE